MDSPRLERGHSDPISYTCTCSARTLPNGGTVLLFYRYWAAPPALPLSHHPLIADLPAFASFHRSLTTTHNLNGKIRLAAEGYNITIGGSTTAITAYIAALLLHWSLAGLPLSTPVLQSQFFKPTPGCACVFDGSPGTASIRIVHEITPMGVIGYAPRDWDSVKALEPAAFHALCTVRDERRQPVLLDVRNAYESRIGYFVTGEGETAVKVGMRRFAQWPRWVKERMGSVVMRDDEKEDKEGREKRPLVTYCTGGIRCEKATRWMAERLSEDRGGADAGRQICTLRGGIAAYLAWMDDEIREGRKMASESLFKGRNYVFDARGSVGLMEAGAVEPVAKCHFCGIVEDRLGKCRSRGCHLVLVVCQDCDEGDVDVRCCADCRQMDEDGVAGIEIGEGNRRRMCACEREREKELWGGELVKVKKGQGWRKAKRQRALDAIGGVDIPVKIIE